MSTCATQRHSWLPHVLSVAVVTIALAVANLAAAADQTRLAWDDCAGGQGTSIANFACNTNEGQHALVASFILDQPFTSNGGDLWGVQARVVFSTSAAIYPFSLPVSDWWRAQSGGCREGVVQVSSDFSSLPPSSCVDPMFSAFGSVFTVVDNPDQQPHGGSHYARILTEVGTNEPRQLNAGVEYLAFRVIIPHVKTTGAGACAGCCESMYAQIESFVLGTNNPYDSRTLPQSATVQWQGSIGCGPTKDVPRSWGQIRSLYR